MQGARAVVLITKASSPLAPVSFALSSPMSSHNQGEKNESISQMVFVDTFAHILFYLCFLLKKESV